MEYTVKNSDKSARKWWTVYGQKSNLLENFQIYDSQDLKEKWEQIISTEMKAKGTVAYQRNRAGMNFAEVWRQLQMWRNDDSFTREEKERQSQSLELEAIAVSKKKV